MNGNANILSSQNFIPKELSIGAWESLSQQNRIEFLGLV